MTRLTNLKTVADRIQVAVANLVSTDPEAADRLRARLADEEPTEMKLEMTVADEEPTEPLRRPRLN